MERSGIFKRRLIHVAKKCGAIAKEADFASVSISRPDGGPKGTPVYEEGALSVIFHDDFDVEAAESIVSQIQRKEIEIAILEPEGAPSPIARIGLEEVSRRGEIVSPERLRAIIRQSTEARIRESFLVAACTNCWEYVELRRVGDGAPERCPRCGRKDTMGFTTESYETESSARPSRRGAGSRCTARRSRCSRPSRSAQTRNEFGDEALYVIAGRGIRLLQVLALMKKRKETGAWTSSTA